MKNLIIAAALVLSGFFATAVPATAQGVKMHKETVEVGTKRTKSGSYYVVKMGGKMYGMVPLTQLERLYAIIDDKHMRY